MMSIAKNLPIMAAVAVAGLAAGLVAAEERADELFVGRATTSITPDRPVPLSGQMRTRISQSVETSLTATALALESRQGEQSVDQATWVSCDLVAIREGIIEDVRARLKDRLPGFELAKLVLSATHTHTAPEVIEGNYDIPAAGVMRPAEYRAFLVEQLAGTDYGMRMKAGSRALQTFVIQLAGRGTYFPAERSMAGGAYGSIVQSNAVGPDGGQLLTERTIAAINSLWPDGP